MARKIRIESAGYHHVYNRGVERRVVFDTTKDKDKFLELSDAGVSKIFKEVKSKVLNIPPEFSLKNH